MTRWATKSVLKDHCVEVHQDWSGNLRVIKRRSELGFDAPALRQWQNILAQLEIATRSDPNLAAMVREALTRMSLGFETARQIPGADRGIVPDAEDSRDPTLGVNQDLLDAPNQTGTMARPGRSGLGPNPPPSQNYSGVPVNSYDPAFPGQHPAHTNANRGKKSYGRSLLLTKERPRNFLLKHFKCASGLCKTDLHFVVSDNSVDMDNDRFTREQLIAWEHQIKGLPLTYDHDRSVRSEIGVITGGAVKCTGELCRLEATAKLFDDHPISQDIKRSAEAGRVLEFSVGATKPQNPIFDRDGVRNISDSELLHVSVVQSGANRNARLLRVVN